MNPNLNLHLKLKLDLPALLRLLQHFGPALFGLALIAVFGYTSWVINQAFNVQPAAATSAPPRITFDQSTIQSLQNLSVVPGQLPPTSLGEPSPFGN